MSRRGLRDLGQAVPSYRNLDGTCALEAEPSGLRYLPGELVSLDDFMPVEIASEGSGRVQVRHVTYDGVAVYPTGFFDVQLGVACSPWPMDDGTTRCVPAATETGLRSWADSACSEPVVQAGTLCTHVHDFALARGYDTCSGEHRVTRLEQLNAEPVVGMRYTGSSAEDCLPLDPLPEGTTAVHRRVSGLVDPSELARIERRLAE